MFESLKVGIWDIVSSISQNILLSKEGYIFFVVFDFGFPPQLVRTLLDCLRLFSALLELEGIQLSSFPFSKTVTKLIFQSAPFSTLLDMLLNWKSLTTWNICYNWNLSIIKLFVAVRIVWYFIYKWGPGLLGGKYKFDSILLFHQITFALPLYKLILTLLITLVSYVFGLPALYKWDESRLIFTTKSPQFYILPKIRLSWKFAGLGCRNEACCKLFGFHFDSLSHFCQINQIRQHLSNKPNLATLVK